MRGNTVSMQMVYGKLNPADSPLYQYDYGQTLILTGIDLPEGRYRLSCNVQYGFPYGDYSLSLDADGVSLVDLSGVAYAEYDEYLQKFIDQGKVDPADLRNSCEQTFSGGVTDAEFVFHGGSGDEGIAWTITIEAIS